MINFLIQIDLFVINVFAYNKILGFFFQNEIIAEFCSWFLHKKFLIQNLTNLNRCNCLFHYKNNQLICVYNNLQTTL